MDQLEKDLPGKGHVLLLTAERQDVEVFVWTQHDEVRTEHDARSATLIVVHLTRRAARTAIRHNSRAVTSLQYLRINRLVEVGDLANVI